MKDNRGNKVLPGCKLRSELFGKDAPTITYEGDGSFVVPGGGHIHHTPESLLDSYWIVVEYPKDEIKLEKPVDEHA